MNRKKIWEEKIFIQNSARSEKLGTSKVAIPNPISNPEEDPLEELAQRTFKKRETRSKRYSNKF